ncbi:MAG: hypothetical protein Q4C84_14700, partial [Bacillota bacterium]|nr:hypothetical protein [Bacillota bacterium]
MKERLYGCLIRWQQYSWNYRNDKRGGQGKQREVEPVAEEPVISERKTYSGFLYLKCKECGEIRGFCPKKGIE